MVADPERANHENGKRDAHHEQHVSLESVPHYLIS